MSRSPAPNRVPIIARAAREVFSDKGFRLAKVADIARRAGVAPGTIYLFAKSKEALFWLALRDALGLPVEHVASAEPASEELRVLLVTLRAFPSFSTMGYGDGEVPSLEVALEEIWDAVAHAAPAIDLVETCARDWPDLAEAFYLELRATLVSDLGEYLVRAAEAGICRDVPHPTVAARLIIETIAWFAMHRLGDPDGRSIPDEVARQVTIDALLYAYKAEKEVPQ